MDKETISAENLIDDLLSYLKEAENRFYRVWKGELVDPIDYLWMAGEAQKLAKRTERVFLDDGK